MHQYRASASSSPVDADGDSPTSKSGPVRFADVLSRFSIRPTPEMRELAAQAHVPGGNGYSPDDDYDGVAVASFWASLGYRVLPLKSIEQVRRSEESLGQAGKLPALKGNQYEQGTRDPEVIERWWTEDPGRGVGISTQANHLLVIDVDNDRQFNGERNFMELADQIGLDLSNVPMSKSPSYEGGYHLYWQLPRSFPKMSLPFISKLAKNVDVPWFVVAPGSWKYTTLGYDYKDNAIKGIGAQTWVAGDPRNIPMAPKVLKDKLMARGAIKGVPPTEVDFVNRANYRTGADGTIDIQYYDTNGIPLGIANGQNGTLYRIACKMAGYSMNVEQDDAVNWCWDIIRRSPQHPHKPAWTFTEVEDLVAGAYVWVDKDNAKSAQADADLIFKLLSKSKKGLVR
jgi:bifunctional DNA primase/polymerase-like protein